MKSIFYFCSLPLRLDSYRGCTHGCLYCFSQKLNNRNERFFSKIVPANSTTFERLMSSVVENPEKNTGPVRSCLEKRIPLHFGCVSDPFQPAERRYRVTLNFLKTLQKHQYPCVISTKSNLVVDPDYINIMTTTPTIIQMSFSTLDDDFARRLEPSATIPSKRLLALKQLAQEGIWTVARLQPFLYPKEKLTRDLFERIADAGVKHVVLEHLRIPTNSQLKTRRKLWGAIGMDMLQVYKELGRKYSRINFELASNLKLKNVLDAKQLAKDFGMSFGSGDNDFHHLSDELCCCGLSSDERFQPYLGHLGYGAFKGVSGGKVSYQYLDEFWQPEGSIKRYINSDCRLIPNNTTINLLKSKVDKPKSSNSPLCFFGLEWSKTEGYYFNKQFLKSLRKREQYG